MSSREALVRVFVFALVALLAGCGAREPALSAEAVLARAVEATPDDARLAGLYDESCRACHTVTDSGAPLALDAQSWAPRWRQGEDVLLQHTISGFNGMPAGGQCFSCTADDYRALIAFMAGREER